MLDVALTVILTIAAITLAVTLSTGDTLWVTDVNVNPVAYAIGAYAPIVITVVALILTVIAFVRKRTTFIYPLSAIVLSGVAWMIGITFIAG